MTQAFNLSQLANNLNSAGQLDATDGLVNALPVANGGTGASSVAGAVSNLASSIYPVGSIYINASVSTNPGTLLGFGTWVAFGSGRVMVGLNTSDTLFDTLGETGGTKDAAVVSHTHTYSSTTATAGSHQHFAVYNSGTDFSSQYTPTVTSTRSLAATGGQAGFEVYTLNGSSNTADGGLTSSAGTHSHTFSGTTASTGSSGTNANIQPYVTVCMWLRTA